MLVLSRKSGQAIVIGEGADQITVTVVSVRADRVRLGIAAPVAIPIARLETKPKEE